MRARSWLATRVMLSWLAVLGVPSVSRADRIAVAPPRIAARGAALAVGLRASLAGGIASAGHEAVAAATIDHALVASPAIAACDTDVCLRKLGELVDARAVVRSAIELVGSSNFSFRLELVDVKGGAIIARLDDTCAICTTREANEALSRSAAELGRKLKATARTVEAVAPVAAEAPSVVAPAKPWTPRAKLYLGLGVTTMLLGVGAIAGGASLIALDGRVTDTSADPLTGDPRQHTFEGKLPGAILAAGGGLLVVGGGILLWRAQVARRAGR